MNRINILLKSLYWQANDVRPSRVDICKQTIVLVITFLATFKSELFIKSRNNEDFTWK